MLIFESNRNVMRALLIVFVFLAFQFGCSQKVSKNMPITAFEQKMLEDAVLIDVRTPGEYAEGHLENAQNINWYDADFAQQFDGMDKQKTVYVYCRSGKRSMEAQKKLQSLGFEHVINLEGGYDVVNPIN